MSDWAAVVLVLGLCALAVAVYGIRALLGARGVIAESAALRLTVDATARNIEALDKRVRAVEGKLNLEGAKLVAAAQRAALPAVMR